VISADPFDEFFTVKLVMVEVCMAHTIGTNHSAKKFIVK
jgi:hypothetical protein